MSVSALKFMRIFVKSSFNTVEQKWACEMEFNELIFFLDKHVSTNSNGNIVFLFFSRRFELLLVYDLLVV